MDAIFAMFDHLEHFADQVLALLPPEVVTALVALGLVFKALAFFFGSCSMAVLPLRSAVNKAQKLAAQTATSADDRALGMLAAFLVTVAPELEKLRNFFEHLSLNRLFAGKKHE